jgi:tetratricopeptide (TPR) repeat protein
MLQVLIRATYLLRRPTVIVGVLILSVGGASLVRLPLFGLPGYELGEAMAVGVGLLGGLLGIAAANQERRLIQGVDPRPRRAIRSDSAFQSVWMPFAAAGLLNLAALAAPFAAAVFFAVTSTRCNPFAQVGFYPVLAIPSALVASATGVLCGLAFRRTFAAGALYVLLLVCSALATGWPLIYGPQIHAFNHFAGYFPGPLYDEALQVLPALLWFRFESILVSLCVLALAAFLLDMKDGLLKTPRARPGVLLCLLILAAGIAATETHAEALGFRTSERFLTEKLGGLRETEHFRIIYPRGKPKEQVDRLARDAEFRYSQVRAFLGGAPDSPIRLYLYRSPEEKLALVGAAHTQFAKPWRLEIHLNDAPFPNPTLKHELAHAMAAPFGSGPFRVTSTFGIWPVMGIVEGLAVAADDAVDELSLHEWAAAMRQQKLAPDVTSLFRFDSFYANPAPRAYVLAGSFLRYLADTHGSEKLRQLYARGDFQSTYQRSLDALAADWGAFLDKIPLDAAAVNQAFARFRRGSIFSRPCAREVASLQTAATEFLKSDPSEALARYQRCAEIQPDEPSFRAGEAKSLELLGRTGEALEVLLKLGDQVKGQPALEAEVAMAEADLEWRRGRVDQAEQHLKKVIDLRPSALMERAARIKLAVLRSKAGPAVWAYLMSDQPDELRLLGLKEALEQDAAGPYLSYLLGRRLTQLGVGSLATGYLSRALSASLPDSIRREAMRLKVEAAYLSGDCAGVKNDLGHLPDFGPTFKSSILEWQERCQFEERIFKGPLVSQSPFR